MLSLPTSEPFQQLSLLLCIRLIFVSGRHFSRHQILKNQRTIEVLFPEYHGEIQPPFVRAVAVTIEAVVLKNL